MKKKWVAAVVGFCAGILNGLFGAGGGMVLVPLMKKVGFEPKVAHATSIAIILPLSAFSAFLYLRAGRVTFQNALPYIPAGLIGAFLGAKLLSKLPDAILRKVFAAFMIFSGVRLLMR
jgi:uncharacterized membrane protein YfcA